jgi:hypothetical protein
MKFCRIRKIPNKLKMIPIKRLSALRRLGVTSGRNFLAANIFNTSIPKKVIKTILTNRNSQGKLDFVGES